MKIVKPSAELISITPNAERLIEAAGRTCYKSEDKITEGSAAKFIQMIMVRGHESVIEHARASIRFICDRGVTHELVRHRLVSYSQESTRYCNYGKAGGISVICPPGLDQDQLESWGIACRESERQYLYLIGKGAKPQIARSVLPTCLKTEIVTTANLREWRHILKLRTAPAAHPQIKEIMLIAGRLLQNECPNVFFDFDFEE